VAYDEELAERVRAALASVDGITEKRMFGGLAFLLGGNMTVAVSSHGGLMVRTDPARDDELLALPHASLMVMRERPMSGWLRVDAEGVRTAAELEAWTERALGYVRTLPAKD
jgi:TfoX/Sxy family transcriptional regulator of competence genes